MFGLKVSFAILVSLSFVCLVDAAADGYFWHFTDNHVQLDYKPGTDPDKECVSGKGKAGLFGDYNCRSPYEVERSAIEKIPSLVPAFMKGKKPDFILWTGDAAARKGGEFSEAIIREEMKNTTNLLTKLQKSLGGGFRVFPAIGNHDSYPQHQFPATDYWVYDMFADLWKDFLSADALKTFKKGGYYTEVIRPKLRLIVLNTVIYSQYNKQIPVTTKDPGGQLAWFTAQLKSAKANGESVYIASHIPPGKTADPFHEEFIQPYLDAMKGYHSIIRGSFYGHIHLDQFQLLGDISTSDYSVSFTTSTMGSKTNKNPMFRVFTFDSSKNFEISDWTTFYMNLEAANKAGKITWKELYSGTTEYGIKNASPSEMKALASKLNSNDALFQKYYQHLRGNRSTNKCTGSCKKLEICRIKYAEPAKFKKCNA